MERDPAFLWETEAIRRPRRHERSSAPSPSAPSQVGTTWVTLRAAHDETGVSVRTIREWARRGHVPGQLTEGRWYVALGDVTSRAKARSLGHHRAAGPRPATSQTGARAGRESGPSPAASSESPPNTMIVPIDAWQRMLTQLGNLHEAGQQLAEARERAAKAETEAKFLKEQLAAARRWPEAPPSGLNSTAEPEPASGIKVAFGRAFGRFRRRR